MPLFRRQAGRPGRFDPAGTAFEHRADHVTTAPSRPLPRSRLSLTLDDLLWFKTSDDDEGRVTVGLLACSARSIAVLVDDDGEARGLRLSRSEAQELHGSLVTWLADTA
jgi:hypothetical protein